MRRSVRLMALFAAVAILGGLLATAGGPVATANPTRPTRVLIIVLDQMRPEYVEQFDMDNVRAIRDGGIDFKNSIVGHMAAETVISHSVITSGRLPKNMGWTNEVYRDAANALAPAGTNDYHVTSSLGCGDFATLTAAAGNYPRLESFLGQLETGGDARFFSVGQKTTAACTAGQPADANDIIVRMGSNSSRVDCDGDGTNDTRFRPPSGVNVPGYIGASLTGGSSSPSCTQPRFNLNTFSGYGTDTTSPAWMYPLDGDRFAFNPLTAPVGAGGMAEQGSDERTLTEGNAGGDVWTADVAIKLMQEEEDWRGMLVSFPDIDKMGHMWGTGDDDDGPSGQTGDVHAWTHLPYVVKKADQQVGRLLYQMDQLGTLDETLIIVTADHGGQTAHSHHGVDAKDQGDYNWYYGSDSDESYKNPSPAMRQLLVDTGGTETSCGAGCYDYPGSPIDFIYGDGHLAAWLNAASNTKAGRIAVAQAMRNQSDVIAAYYRDGGRYMAVAPPSGMTAAERQWFRAVNAGALVNTMAASNGPDVVGLLKNETSYGVFGDHGGHQKQIQRIPMIMSWSGLQSGVRMERIRLVDLVPTILQAMGLSNNGVTFDGKAYSIIP
jgi:hypothetical protein